MKLILCQPSTQRFRWELDVFLSNVRSLCDHEVILLFDNQDLSFADYFSVYDGVQCFFYEDRRVSPCYISSIRPYLWVQFLTQHPEMAAEDFFYVDSDIIFREMIDFDALFFNEKTYAASLVFRDTDAQNTNSKAKSYLDPAYINSKGDFYLEEMAGIIGITKEQAAALNGHAGGAQWILSKPTLQFWQKVYCDCENLYRYFMLAEVMLSNSGNTDALKNPIQKWCADMWALLWNTVYFGIAVETPIELDFCWPNNPLECWKNCKILHNAGVLPDMRGELFFKGDYGECSPFEERTISCRPDRCSIYYVEAILKAKTERLRYEAK